MRVLLRLAFVLILSLLVVAGSLFWLTTSPDRKPTRPGPSVALKDEGEAAPPPGKGVFDLNLDRFEDGGYAVAMSVPAPARDLGSLQELRESVRGRGRRGIRRLYATYDKLHLDSPPSKPQLAEKAKLERSIGLLYMYDGKFLEAAEWIEKAMDTCRGDGFTPEMRNSLRAIRGIISMRQGEVQNCLECVGPSSCIFPIAREAVHRNQAGSREAVRWFTDYLKESPRDIRIIWLLNIAYMTLGEYPEKVPPQYLLPTKVFQSRLDVGHFENVASIAGLTSRGPNLAGGSVFDDFNGDHLPDLFTTSLDADLGASLYLNRGDGTFADHSAAAGLGDQVYALNVTRTDFDNDGDLDVLLLRGAWETPERLSLLRNRGDGTFDDVTVAAGLAEPIAAESAAWGDYDNDGLLDVFVCGEYLPPGAPAGKSPRDPRNLCRLYHNEGNGTFRNVAVDAGVTNERCAKGSAWGDYDQDGRIDLFVSNMGQESRLYHNEGGGKFVDVAPKLGVTGTSISFACWFWDFDNDGKLDLYVNDYRAKVAEVLASVMGAAIEGSSRPRLYRNIGSGAFEDVTQSVGLDRAMAPMGANFGDIDNDGYLDMYLGTGDMSYEGLDINLLLKNVDGHRFQDVTMSSGTGHIQKGHGVSFADYNHDGNLDFFVEHGGATPGDQAYNSLFKNPGHRRHWLKVKLVGTKTNRAAIGASIQVDRKDADNSTISVYRTIGNNSSFGGNTLVESIGLLDATRVAQITINWPTSKTQQTFKDLEVDRFIEITEGSDEIKVISLSPPKPVSK